MFCFNCGSELVEGAAFCHQCGTKVNKDTSLVQVNRNDVKEEFNRGALKIYLNDILALECIVNRFMKDISELERQILCVKSNNYYQRYVMNPEKERVYHQHIHFLYNGSNFYVLTDEKTSFTCMRNNDSVWTSMEEVKCMMYSKFRWFAFSLDKKEARKLDGYFNAAYEDFRQKAPIGYQKNLELISRINQKKALICKECDEAKMLLQKSYQVNIIPETFRNNLYAIYYLYNFISTSDLSFETALLHYNLEEIKAKLDTIIVQQQEIIINQARVMAQNKVLLEQNQRQLENLSSIASNSYYAAQYAEIAAYNAETCAWISLANCFRE